MTDRSADGVCDFRGRQEQQQEQAPEGSQNAAPPHPPGQNHHSRREVHSHPHQDPHELQLQQGDLRHRQEARGEPRGASNILTGAVADATDATDATADQQRHPKSRADLLHAALEAAAHSTDPTAPSSLTSTTASQAPTVAAAASAISAPPSTDRGQTPTPQIVDRDHIRSLASGEPSPTSSGFATPTEHSHRRHIKLRPLVKAIMAFEKGRKFSTGTSVHRKRQMSTLVEKEGHFGPALTVRFHPLSFLSSYTKFRSELAVVENHWFQLEFFAIAASIRASPASNVLTRSQDALPGYLGRLCR
jgi:hypothetical protein